MNCDLDAPTQWHVAFEGPIAAGKTTIATLFAKASGARLLLEDLDSNEFLADFYANPDRWALPMQLGFLLARHAQFYPSSELDVPVVADHTYAKDSIFARLLLSGRDLRLYECLHRRLKPPPERPSLIVYLDAPDEVLLERIRIRNRPYEAAITVQYLGQVREAYQRNLIAQPTLRIVCEDTSALDLESEDQMTALYRRILECIPTISDGLHKYSPSGGAARQG